MRHVNSGTYFSFFHPPEEVVNIYGLQNIKLISWKNRDTILGINTNDLISELLHKSIMRKYIEKDLIECQTSKLYYFPEDIKESDNLHFERPDGSNSHVQYHGKRKHTSSQEYYKYFIAPHFRIYQNLYDDYVAVLNIRYRFTDLHNRPLQGSTVNSRRKHLTQNWWNNHWFDRLLAVSQFLGEDEFIQIVDPKDENRKVLIEVTPTSLLSPISINEELREEYPDDGTFLEINELTLQDD